MKGAFGGALRVLLPARLVVADVLLRHFVRMTECLDALRLQHVTVIFHASSQLRSADFILAAIGCIIRSARLSHHLTYSEC